MIPALEVKDQEDDSSKIFLSEKAGENMLFGLGNVLKGSSNKAKPMPTAKIDIIEKVLLHFRSCFTKTGLLR